MNRQQRRAARAIQHELIGEQKLSDALTEVPRAEYPLSAHAPEMIWRSKKYLVQLWHEPHGVLRLSVCRTKMGKQGTWQDGLTWDELQAIKREVGFGDHYAVEVYPRDKDVVNVSNIRHLFITPDPLPIGWFK